MKKTLSPMLCMITIVTFACVIGCSTRGTSVRGENSTEIEGESDMVSIFHSPAFHETEWEHDAFDSAWEQLVREVTDMTPERLRRRIAEGANVNERMASNGDTPLMLIAMLNPDPETVQVLVDAGANANARNDNGQTALFLAFWWFGITNSTPEKVLILLKAGAEVDTPRHYTPLTLAIMRRHHSKDRAPVLESLNALLDAGTDVNAACWLGFPLLMLAVACEWSDIEVVRLLIEAGADVNARRDSYTVLMYAVASNWKGPPSSKAPFYCTDTSAIVKLLIDAGADVNAQSKDGWTALMVAARYRSVDFVEVLLEAGANIATVNHEGMTAYDLAFQNDIEVLRNTKTHKKLWVR